MPAQYRRQIALVHGRHLAGFIHACYCGSRSCRRADERCWLPNHTARASTAGLLAVRAAGGVGDRRAGERLRIGADAVCAGVINPETARRGLAGANITRKNQEGFIFAGWIRREGARVVG